MLFPDRRGRRLRMRRRTIRNEARFRRALRLAPLEQLEDRQLLASDWQNPFVQRDVTGDGVVVPQDALVAINELNERTLIDVTGQLPSRQDHPSKPYYDATGDGKLVPQDVLVIINGLNNDETPPSITAQLFRDTAPQGGSNNDGLTSDPTVSGTVTDDLTGVGSLLVQLDGGASKRVTIGLDGTFQYTPDLPLDGSADGEHTLGFVGSDGQRHTSIGFNVTFLLDTVAPTAPTEASFDSASDTGSSNSDGITSDNTPTFRGDAAAGTVITLFANGVIVGTTTANSPWEITSDSLADGTYDFTVTGQDVAGSSSSVVTIGTLTIDSQAPMAPANVHLDSASDTGASSSDRITNDDTPQFTGDAEDGSTVLITRQDTAVEQVAGGDAWNFTSGNLADGDHTFEFHAIDVAGNISSATTVIVSIDTLAPAAPSNVQLDTASDTGASNTDGVTRDSAPTVQGDYEIGSTVLVTVDSIAVAPISGGTRWNFTTDELNDGEHLVATRSMDLAGNSSNITTVSITIDTAAPAAPFNVQLEAASDTGASDTDSITRDSTPTLAGDSELGSTVLVTVDGTASGPIAGGTGWNFTTDALTDGDHTLAARAVDLAGNTSDETTFSVSIDTVAPPAPTNFHLEAASDTGSSSTDRITSDNTPTLAGDTESSSTVQITVDDLAAEQFTSGTSWTFTTASLTDGDHVLGAKTVDLAGNESSATSVTVSIDTAAPPSPSNLRLDPATDSGTSNADGVTNNITPTFLGDAEIGTTVLVSLNGTALGDVVGESDWSYAITSSLADGDYDLNAQAVDVAGNVSAAATLTVTIDTIAPPGPSSLHLSATSDTGASSTDGITKDDTPTVTGDSESGSTVLVTVDGAAVGQVPGGSGWSYEIAESLTDGDYDLNAQIVDLAGNIGSSSTITVTIDTVAPPAPTNLSLDAASDSGVSNTDQLTNDKTPTILGNFDDESTILLLVDGNVAAGGGATGNGAFSLTFDSLTDGDHSLGARAVDVAGNNSDTTLSVTIDTAAPSPPTNVRLDPASDSGTSNSDGITNNDNPTVVGDAETNATVELFVDGNLAGQGTANSPWSIATGPQADGVFALTARGTDLAGNTGPFSAPASITIDTAVPLEPLFQLSNSSDTGTPGDGITSAARVVLLGHSDSGITVRLVGTSLTSLTNLAGNYQFTGIALEEGDNTLTVIAADAAGNERQFESVIQRTPGVAVNDPVLTWNQVLLEAIRNDATSVPIASRTMAMVHAAIYDAVSAIDGLPSLYVALPAQAGASAEAAVAAAAHRVLVYAYPAQQATLDTALANSLALVTDGISETDGVNLGEAVADSVIALRDRDGWDDFLLYTEGPNPGDWQPTPPMFAPALLPQWADLQPWAMTSSGQFRPAPPPELTSQEYADAVNEVQSLGRGIGSTRTADETEIARFWADVPGTYTPPGHWNQIAAGVALTAGNSLAENARLFAQLNLAMADAAIAAWDAKYAYNLWRPVTAIRQAAEDGNPATSEDPTWTPLLITPNFPEFTSGHSTCSGAAAEVLSRVFGDQYNFTTTSLGLPGVQRSYSSFEAAAQEAGRSRILGGIHYEFSNQSGQAAGHLVGANVLSLFSVATDNRPPVIIVDNAPDQVSTQNINITGRVLDNLAGVQTLEFALDDGPFANLLFTATGTFTAATTLSLTGSDDGQHSVTFRATDGAGNSSLQTHSFAVDTQAPTIEWNSPADGSDLVEETDIHGDVDGTGSVIVALNYVIDGGDSVPLLVSPSSGKFAASLDLSQLAVGNHTVQLTAIDAAGQATTLSRSFNLAAPPVFAISTFRPTEGAQEVGVTIRPRIDFTRPVNPTTLNASNFFVQDPAGNTLNATIVPANDGSFAWLFLHAPMPGASRMTMTLDGSSIQSTDGVFLDADGDGHPGGVFHAVFHTVSRTDLANTSIAGILADPGADLRPGTPDDVRRGPDGVLQTADDAYLLPIAGARVFILGREDQFVITDSQGRFALNSIPVGDVKLAIDGLTATNPPAGFYFPEMVMDLKIQPGQINNVMAAMRSDPTEAADITAPGVYLPRLQNSLLQDVDAADTTNISVNPESAPNLTPEQRALLTIEIQPGSLIGPDGQPLSSGEVGISTVPPELVRDMLPPGVLEHTFDITVQAPGISNFSTPAPMTFPNVFNAPPGSKLNFLSFDHTTGRLVIEGTATVSEDGESVTTDPGTGITHPGWHGLTPPGNRARNDVPRGPGNPPTPPTPPPAPTPPPVPPPSPTPPPPATPSPPWPFPPPLEQQYDLGIRFIDNSLSATQQQVVLDAARRWEQIILGDLPSVFTEIGIVDDLVVDVRAVSIDDALGILGRGAATMLRGDSQLPARGYVDIDTADLGQLEANGQLTTVVLHQLGHALGLGKIVWSRLNLIDDSNASEPLFVGPIATSQFNAIFGISGNSVPLENVGDESSLASHWRESVLDNELMTGELDFGLNPISRITAGALADMRYTVALNATDSYNKPVGDGTGNGPGGNLEELDLTPTIVTPVGFWGDFATANSPVPSNYQRVTDQNDYSAAQGYGWLNTPGSDLSASDITGVPGANDLVGDFVATRDATFAVDLPPGVYDVKVTVGDLQGDHRLTEIFIEDVLRGNISTQPGQLITNTYRVNVSDGQLQIQFVGETDAAIDVLEVNQVSNDSYVEGATLPMTGRFYFAIENLSNGFVMRGSAQLENPQPLCPDGVFLASNTSYRQWVYHVDTGFIGYSDFTTPSSGIELDMPDIILGRADLPDEDGDGLPDLAEFIANTNANLADTDDDGLSDHRELELGTDPLGGSGIPTGVISGIELDGEAKEVVVEPSLANPLQQLAYVATGLYGLGIVDVTQVSQPVLLSRVKLLGNGLDVSVDNANGIAAVASGTGGLHLVDIRDPAVPRLIGSTLLPGGAARVEAFDGLAYVASGDQLIAVELATQVIIQSESFQGQTIVDIAREGTTLIAIDSANNLHAFGLSSGNMVPQGTLSLPAGGGKLFLGGGIGLVGTGSGFQQGFLTVDVSDPNDLRLISDRDDPAIVGIALANTGSGIGVSVGSILTVGGPATRLDILDLQDLENTAGFVAQIPLTGEPQGVVIAAGFAFVASGADGLQVVNFLPLDSQGQSPSVSIASTLEDADLDSAGVQIVEGTLIPLRAAVEDDVQVSNVEFFVDGELVGNDFSYPFDFTVIAPTLSSGNSSVTMQARAIDTGGNASLSDELTFELVADTFAPQIIGTVPAEGQRRQFVPAISLRLSEPIDPVAVDLGGMTLDHLGTDGFPGGGDDTSVALTRFEITSTRGISIFPEAELDPGNYRLILDPAIIADRAGNQLELPFELSFAKRPESTPLVFGSVVIGEIADPSESEVFTFTGTPGQRLVYDGFDADLDTINSRLQSPSGNILWDVNSDSDAGPVTLTEPGIYRLTIYPQNNVVGDFQFQVTDASALPQSDFDSVTAADLDPGQELEVFRFVGAKDQHLFFDIQDIQGLQAYYLASWTLYGPGNASQVTSYLVSDMETILPTDGEYLLVVSGSNGPTPIAYQFEVVTPDATSSALTLGQTVQEQISQAGEVDEYTFVGAPGQRILYDAWEVGSGLGVRLVSPSGQFQFNQNADSDGGPITLTEAGTYRLVLDGSGETVAAYSFQVLNVGDQPTLTLDTPHGPTDLDPGQSEDVYRFTGTKDQHLYFDIQDIQGLQASHLASWSVFGPGNQLITSNHLTNDMEVSLPASGEYLLVVSGSNGPTPVTYQFAVVTPDALVTPLILGQTVQGQIGQPGDTSEYTFAGTPGQRIVYDALDDDFDSISVQLISPNGTSHFHQNSDTDAGPITLTESGTYRLIFDGPTDAVADYAFRLLNVADQPVLTLDTTVGPTDLDPGQSADVYRFQGTKDQHLYFHIQDVQGLDADFFASWSLFGPGNDQIAGDYLTNDMEVELPTNGQYVLTVLGGNGPTPVSYQFEVVTSDITSTALTFGQSIQGQIIQPGDVLEYTFAGILGQRIVYDPWDDDFDLIDVELLSPSGATVLNQNADDDAGPITLTEAGTYRLVFDGDGGTVGDTDFQMLDIADQPTLTLDARIGLEPVPASAFAGLVGSYVDQNLRGVGSILDSWTATQTISGTRNDPQIRFSQETWGTLADVGVTGGSDEDWDNFSVQWDGVIVVTQPNTHLYLRSDDGSRMLIDMNQDHQLTPFDQLLGGFVDNSFDSGGSETSSPSGALQPGSYEFRIQYEEESGDNSMYLLSDEGIDLTPGQSADFYRFTGLQGERLYFDIQDIQDQQSSVTWSVYGPGNQQISLSDLANDMLVSLPEDGEYVLGVVGGNGATPVAYGFQVGTPATNVAPLNLGQVVSADVDEPGEKDIYTFSGTPGQQLVYDSRDTDFDAINVHLEDPTGNFLFDGNSNSDFGIITVTQPGTHRLILDGGEDTVGDYEFTLFDVSTVLPLDLGTVVSGALDTGRSMSLYHFTGMAGQRVDFQSIAASRTDADWWVWTPLQQILMQNSIANDLGTATLPVSGNYVVAISGNFEDLPPLDFQFQATDVSDGPVVTSGLGDIQEGSIAPGEISQFEFDASAGTKLLLDSLDRNMDSIRVLIQGPNNESVLDGNASLDQGPVVLPRGGTYHVTVSGLSPDDSGDFRFRLLDLDESSQLSTFELPQVDSANDPFETDIFRFQASAGELLAYDALDLDYESLFGRWVDPAGGSLAVNWSGQHSDDSGWFVAATTGTYYLILESQSGDTSDYEFQVLNRTDLPQVPLGTVVNGTLEPGSEKQAFRLTGTAGQRFFLLGLNPSACDALWSIYRPDGVSLVSACLNSDMEFTLPVDGDYLFDLSGYSADPLEFGFELVSSETDVLTVVFDVPQTGLIANAGDILEYTFTGTVGQQLFYDAQDSDHDGIHVSLLAPDGSTIFNNNSDDDNGPITLVQSGNYRLSLDGLDRTTGDFKFRLLNVASAPLLPLDTFVADSVPDGSSTKLYRHPATAGERLYFESQWQPDCDANWTILSPTGESLAANSICSDLEIVLPVDGQYLLAVQAFDEDSEPFAYHFQVDTPQTSTTPLILGTEAGGSFDLVKPGHGLSSPTDVVRGPNGDLFVGSHHSGILRYDSATGEFKDVFVPTNANGLGLLWGITFGTDDDLYLGNDHGNAILRFDGATGNFIDEFVTAQSGGLLTPRGQTFGPDGNLYVASVETNSILRYDGTTGAFLDEFVTAGSGGLNGPHHPVFGPDGNLYVSSYDSHEVLRYDSTTGAFLDSFVPTHLGGLTSPVAVAFIPGGDMLVASLGSNQVLRFDGASGAYRGVFASGGNLAAPVALALDANNNLLVASSSANRVLRYDGIHGGCVSDLMICVPGEIDEFTFAGAAGQQLFYDTLQQDNQQIAASLIAPSGATVFFPSTDSDFGPFTLSETGSYRLVFDGSGRRLGDDRFNLLNVASAPLLPLHSFIADSVASGSSAKLYRHNGTAGQRLYFESLSPPDCNASWTLLSPTFQTVAGSSICADFEAVLPTDGQYLLVVQAYQGGLEPFSYYIQVDTPQSSTTPLTLGTEAGGSFDFIKPGHGLLSPTDVVRGPNGDLFVGSYTSGVLRYESTTGEFTDVFVSTNANGLGLVWGIAFGPDDDLYVGNDHGHAILRYDGATGNFIDEFVAAGSGGLQTPRGQTFGPDGNLYVASVETDTILRYDGTTGDFIDVFVTAGSGGLDAPHHPVFGPDGNLYVSSLYTHSVLRYDGTTGTFLDAIVPTQFGGLNSPLAVAFLPGGDLLVASLGTNQVLRYDSTSGDFRGVFAAGGNLSAPVSMTFDPNSNLLVASSGANRVLRFDGTTGGCVQDQMVCIPGEQDEFTFAGIAGQQLIYDALQHENQLIDVSLISPSGATVFSASASQDYGPITLSETGSYRLVFDGNGRRTGDNRFSLLNDASALVLPLNTFVADSLASGSSAKLYRHDGSTGDRLYFESQWQPDCNGYWTLLSPAGIGLSSASVCGDLDVVLPVDGQYLLFVQGDQGSSAPFAYHFHVHTPQINSTLLTLGSEAGGSFDFVKPGNGLVSPTDVAFGPDGDLYVGSHSFGVLRYNGATGEFADLFVSTNENGLGSVWGITFGPDSNLYVVSSSANAVLRFNGATGEFLDEFVAAQSGGLNTPRGLTFGPDGNLYVASAGTNSILRYSGLTGAFLDEFVAGGSGGLNSPHHPVFGPDGHLYVSSYYTNSVLRFDGTTGAFLDAFVAAGFGGLSSPLAVAFLPGGDLLVASSGTNQVLRYDGLSGALRGVFAAGGELAGPVAMTFDANHNLLVAAENSHRVLRYEGTTGSCLQDQMICVPGEQDEFTFAGTVGQRLYYDALELDYQEISVTLYAPSGAVLFTGAANEDVGPFTLGETGTFRLVFDGDNRRTGDDHFQLLDASSAEVLPTNLISTRTLAPGTSTKLFRFDGIANQQFDFDTQGVPICDGIWTLYGPGNQELAGECVGFDFGAVLPATGQYLLVVSGGTFESPFEFTFTAHTSALLGSAPTLGNSAAVVPPALTRALLNGILDAAVDRWNGAGLGREWLEQQLADVVVQLTDLPEGYLGLVTGRTIHIDRDAGGVGWFVDTTPDDDLEFFDSVCDENAAEHYDLLTVLAHELGHLLGHDDHLTGAVDDVMSADLQLGQRRLPGAADVDSLFADWE